MAAIRVEYVIKTSEGNHIIQCPVSWYGVDTRTFQLIVDKWKNEGTPESIIQLFALLTGEDFLNVMAITDPTIERKINSAVNFVFNNEWNFDKLEMPGFFKLNDNNFLIPRNLGDLSIGQNLMLRKIFVKGEDTRKYIAFAIAVYMQPIIDGAALNLDRVRAIEQEILCMPITQTYAIGTFFLRRLSQSGTQPSKLWHQIQRIIQSMQSIWKLVRWLRLNCLKPIKILTTLESTL